MKHLIIGDAHAKPEIPNNRFDWLGELILEERPDVIVEIGDLFDMPSLSTYDRGKLAFEGRRYKDDIEAGNDALARIMRPMEKYNNSRSRIKKRTYQPRLLTLDGNHFGGRISKAVQSAPELSGYLSVTDADYGAKGFEFYHHPGKTFIDGICYAHFIQAGNSDRAIGGINAGRQLLQKTHMSVVVGHSHLFKYHTETDARGHRLHAVVAGCYLAPDQYEDYAKQSNEDWWRGIVLLDSVENGDFSVRLNSILEIKQRYA